MTLPSRKSMATVESDTSTIAASAGIARPR
jgi:hypothetical protein